MHKPPSAAELICLRTLAVAYILLQVTKSLSLYLICELLSDQIIINGVIAAQATDYTRLYCGLGQFIPQGIL